ncbi:unnamed protein product [Closterium sp. NIES-53]
MDVWGPARVRGQGHERYFLLIVDDYSRYTTVFPLRSKGEVPGVLIDWIRGTRRQLSEKFGSDLPVLRLHSDRGGEFSLDLLRAVCRLEGIRQTFTLPASPQQNGIAERRIGMINLQPRVSLPETTPTLRWTGKVGDTSTFRVWGSRAFVHDTTADKLSSRAVLCVFLGFLRDAPGWQFYHPTSRRVLSSQDVTFDESVSYYRLFPHRIASSPSPPLFLAPRPPLVDPLPPQGPAPSGVSQVDPAEPVEVAVNSGAPRGTEPGGAESWGAEPGGAETGRAGPARATSGGTLGVPSRREPLSPQRLCEWYSRRCRVAAGAAGAGATGATGGATGAGAAGGAGGAGGAAGAGDTAGAAGGAAAGAAGGAPGATGGAAGPPGSAAPGAAGGAALPRPYFVQLLQQVLGSPPSLPPTPPPFLSPPPAQSQSQLPPASPLLGPSPYSGPTRGLTERREPDSRPVSPASRPASPVRTVRAGRVSRSRLPPVPGTHSMTLRPSTTPQRVSLPSPPASSLPDGPDPESDSLRAASPTVTRFLATTVTDPLFESSAASALVAELEDLECFVVASPHLVSMLLAPEGDPDALDIPTPRSYAEAIEGTYVDEVPPPGANIVSGIWIFRVKRPPGSPPAFKARYVARGFSQRQGVDFFKTFSPTPKMTTLWVLLHVAAQRDYELHSLDFSTAFLQGSLHEEIWLRRPPGFTWSFPAGTQWSLWRTSGMGLVLGGRARVVLTGHADASWVDDLATQRSSQGYTFSLGSGSVSWRSTRSSSVLSSSCEAEIYAGAMAAQELRWLTYLLTDLGEVPRSPPVLYVDNKAMLALCQEHRLEHRTKHIALRYFLARELQ